MSDRILSPLDEAMLIGYFAATGIKDKDEKSSIRATLTSELSELEQAFRAQNPEPRDNPSESKNWQRELRTIKRDYLARREARVLHENQSAVSKTIETLPESQDPWNIKSAEKARTHILYHQKMEGYGNAIIFRIPAELKTDQGDLLTQDTVRADALYAMMYSLFSDKDFVKNSALSLSERAIKKRLKAEKENFQSLLNDPEAFLNKVSQMIREETIPPDLPELDMHHDEEEENQRRQEEDGDNPSDSAQEGEAEDSKESKEDIDADEKNEDSIKTHLDDPSETSTELLQKPHNPDFIEEEIASGSEGKDSGYKIFTTKYDEEIRADDLADKGELADLYKLLQSDCAPKPGGWREPNIKQSLATHVRTTHERRQDNGRHIDPATLSEIVAASVKGEPIPSDIHIRQKQTNEPDTCVTLLLDNSGSMRGAPISYVAQFAEIFGNILARHGIPFEILGFTTRSWKGGQARQDWINANRPAYPGRLNDLRHVIYKDMNKPWKRERINLGLLKKESLLKENIDGESLDWAYKRALKTPYRRKIIIPLVDGAPIDDSTLSTNSSKFLEDHLHKVIAKIEKTGQAELHAIGIGDYNTSRFYRNNYSMSHTENPYIAAGEILDSIARFAPGQQSRIKSRLRMQRARDAEAGRETGRGADRLTFK